MNNMYLITGGCGFIGSHIADALVADEQSVRIFDNLSSGHYRNIEHLESAIEFIDGDIRDRTALAQAVAGTTHIFHEAALVSVFGSVEQPRDNHDINLTGTLNVLEAARKHGVRRVVMASSAAIYGNTPELPKREDMRPEPESPYAIGKITAEYYLRVFAQLYGLETVSLRYFNVYGPRQDPSSMYSGVISRFTEAMTAGETPMVFGDGKQTRDFVFVKDVVQANLLAMRSTSEGSGDVFNVGTGKSASLLDLLRILAKLTGNDNAPKFKDVRSGDIRHSVSDIGKAQKKLGYIPHYDLHAGLEQLIESMKL